MKAVVVTGGLCPSLMQVQDEFTEPVFIIAADSGLRTLHQWKISPDLLVGDFDSVEKELYEMYSSVEKIKSSTYKDYSDTELALVEACKRGCEEIILIGGGEGRLDHSLALVMLFSQATTIPTPDRWYTACERIMSLTTGTHRLDCVIGDTVSFFPLGPARAVSSGLEWSLEHVGKGELFCSLSNLVTEQFPMVTVESGSFLCIHPYKV